VVVLQPSGAALAFDDLPTAVAVADEGATVVLCPGVHEANVRILRAMTLTARDGGSGGSPSILLPAANGPVVSVAAGQALGLVGLHIRGCRGVTARAAAGGSGSSAWTWTSSGSGATGGTTVQVCESSSSGVAMADDATLTVDHARISHHDAGGIHAERAQAVSVLGGRLDHNQAERGGGLYATGASVDLEGVTVDANEAWDAGGGAYLAQCEVTTSSGAFTANRASAGGGLYADDSTLSGDGTRWDGNAARRGGGVYLRSSTLTGSDLRIQSNAADEGGGAYLRGASLTGDALAIEGNDADRGGGVFFWDGGGIGGVGAAVQGNSGRLGGGLFVDAPDADVTTAGRVHGNEALRGGGVFLLAGTLHADTFTANRSTDGTGGAALVAVGAAIDARDADFGGIGVEDNDPPDVFLEGTRTHEAFGTHACFVCTGGGCTPC
jgi:hypothetical protein